MPEMTTAERILLSICALILFFFITLSLMGLSSPLIEVNGEFIEDCKGDRELYKTGSWLQGSWIIKENGVEVRSFQNPVRARQVCRTGRH